MVDLNGTNACLSTKLATAKKHDCPSVPVLNVKLHHHRKSLTGVHHEMRLSGSVTVSGITVAWHVR